MNSTSPNNGVATYDVIAQEYYDAQRHPTCSNLNHLSRVYLQRHLNALAHRQPVLETGAGDSAVAELLHAAGMSLQGLMITDSSASMLSHSGKWTAQGAELRVADAEQVDSPADSFDILVSSLGDPYNTTRFWQEAARVLRRNGLAIFTVPSFRWAARYRAAHGGGLLDKAEFRLRDGSKVFVPSMIVPLEAQVEMMERAGLIVIDFEDLGADQLGRTESRAPKTDVFGNEPSSLVWGFIARKDTDPNSAAVHRSWRESSP